LVLFENKTVRSLKKYCTVDLLQFFKKRSTEIRLGSRRHFGLFQKKSSCMMCLYLKAEQNVEEIFEKSQFLKIRNQKPVFAA
jgi:hypothetical protein